MHLPLEQPGQSQKVPPSVAVGSQPLRNLPPMVRNGVHGQQAKDSQPDRSVDPPAPTMRPSKRSRTQVDLDGADAEQISWFDFTLGGGRDVVNSGTKVQVRFIMKDETGEVMRSSIRGELVRHTRFTEPELFN